MLVACITDKCLSNNVDNLIQGNSAVGGNAAATAASVNSSITSTAITRLALIGAPLLVMTLVVPLVDLLLGPAPTISYTLGRSAPSVAQHSFLSRATPCLNAVAHVLASLFAYASVATSVAVAAVRKSSIEVSSSTLSQAGAPPLAVVCSWWSATDIWFPLVLLSISIGASIHDSMRSSSITQNCTSYQLTKLSVVTISLHACIRPDPLAL